MNRARNQTQRQEEAIEREEARIGDMGETQTLPEHTGMIEKLKRKGNQIWPGISMSKRRLSTCT